MDVAEGIKFILQARPDDFFPPATSREDESSPPEIQNRIIKLDALEKVLQTQSGRDDLEDLRALSPELSCKLRDLLKYYSSLQQSSNVAVTRRSFWDGCCAVLLRIARNICVANVANYQNVLRETLFIHPVRECIVTATERLRIEQLQMSSLVVLKASVQFLSNFLTGSPSNQHYIWTELIKDAKSPISTLSNAAVSGHGDDMLVANIAMLIYNSSIKSPERQSSLLASPGAQTIFKSLVTYFRHSNADPGPAKSFYWINLLIRSVLNKLDKLFEALDAEKSELWQPTTEQETILDILDADLEEKHEKNQNNPEAPLSLNVDDLAFLLSLLGKVGPAVELALRSSSSSSTSGDRSIRFTYLISSIVSTVITGPCPPSVKRDLLERGCLEHICRVLSDSYKWGTAEINATNSQGKDASKSVDFGLRASLIQLLANLAFKCREVQDALRTMGALPLVLNGCRSDDNNPLVREWAIFAVRNICEDNDENQRYIAELKPQGAAENPDLDRLGLKAEVDSATGKVKFSPKD